MNLVELQKKLLAAARTDVPGDQVPYAFEKRIMALIVAGTVTVTCTGSHQTGTGTETLA